MSSKIDRRRFLQQSALVTVGLAVAACAPAATPAPQPTAAAQPTRAPEPTAAAAKPPAPATAAPTAAPAAAVPTKAAAAAPTAAAAAPAAAGKYNEAPMLAELVKAGKLPPIDQRLPKDPKLVNELPEKYLKAEIGKYGGTLRTVTSQPDWDADVFVMNNESLINTPAILCEEFTPNVVKDFKISADNKEFTFVLRQGLKWSDGKPVVMDDFRFAVEDVVLNKELTPNVPTWLKAGNRANGTPFAFEVVDDWTFKIKFDQPYGGFPVALGISGWRSYTELLKPSHYLKAFHKKYTDEAKLKELAVAAKLETWVQLFGKKDVIGNNELTKKDAIGFPRLYPWLLVESGSQFYNYERNPYYYKVDAAGNQLPYIDKIQSLLVPDIETVAMKHISGEIDFARESSTLAKIPLYKENEKSGYRVIMNRLQVTSCNLAINQTHKDPVWREVVRNKKFRQALNYAIDRKELLDSVWYGQAKLPDVVPTEFSVEKANALLSEIGMSKKDADGFRLGPDGKTFLISIESGAHAPDMLPVGELFVQFWNKVGIKTQLKRIDQQLWGQRNAANELYATTMWNPLHIFFQTTASWGVNVWGVQFERWYNSGGKDGEEPTGEYKTFVEMVYDTLRVPVPEVPALIDQLKKSMNDNVFHFFTCMDYTHPVIANKRLANLSESRECFGIANNFAAEQYFYKS